VRRLVRRRSPVFGLLAAALSCAACGDSAGPEAAAPPAPGRLAVDQEEAARLRALGYADVSDTLADPNALGVVHHDREATQPGLGYLTHVRGCSSQLITLEGRALRSWQHRPCFMWGNSVLLPDGDVLAIHRSPRDKARSQQSTEIRELLRLDWDGEVVWSRQLPVHHDVELTPRNQIATLTYAHRLVPSIHETIPVKDHNIALFSLEGELLHEVSILDLLETAPEPFRLEPIEPHFSTPDQMDEVDLLHSNAIEWMRRPELAEKDALYAPSNLLLTLRHQNAVAIIDWDARKVLWTWGQDELSGPHDATVLANGNVLVFDNGLGRDWSRVVEVEPRSRRIVWEYRAPEGERMFTATRGAAQRLENGNTLITDSELGRVFEVTPSGRVVWDFRNPNLSRKGKPIVIVRMRRLPEPPAPDGPFRWFD